MNEHCTIQHYRARKEIVRQSPSKSKSFHILEPLQIPTPESVQSSIAPDARSALLQLAEKGRWASNVDAVEAFAESMAALQLEIADDARDEGLYGGQQDDSRPSRDDNAHDDYFGIRRVNGPVQQIFLQTIVKANLILFEDSWNSPFTITPAKLNCLDSALNSLLLWTLGSPAGEEHHSEPRITEWVSQGSTYHSMVRWIRGHQIFAALTQGLTAVFRDLRSALQSDYEPRISQAVDLAVRLLEGSAASLEFTGDFPPADYTGLIRPSMTPPLVPDTFSGLLSVDHRHLIHLLREMKPQLDSLAGYPSAHHQRIASAVAAVYDSHRFVCDRLVGKCPSLMMASGSKKSGAEQIEKFKHLRLKVFEPEVPIH